MQLVTLDFCIYPEIKKRIGLSLHNFHFQEKKICVFESDILHILLADSILSTTKRFRKMKKLQFLKVGDYVNYPRPKGHGLVTAQSY